MAQRPAAKEINDWQPVSGPSDWQTVNTSGTAPGESPNYGPGVTVVNPTIGQIGKGFAREGANLLSGAYAGGRRLLEMVPGVSGSGFDKSMLAHQATLDQMAQPQNVGEAMGRTGAEMASYLLPAKAESRALEATEDLPRLLRPAARIGVSTLSNATMSGLNREPVGTGTAVGAGGGLIGEAGRAIAPAFVRSAIPGINRETANSVLRETHGVRPSTVLGGVEQRMREAGEAQNAAIAAAERRNAPRIAGFLMPPREEIPLGRFEPDVRGELIPAARLPQTNVTGMGTDLSPVGTMGRIRGVPGRNVEQLGSEARTIPARLQREAYVTSGTHEAADLPRSGPGVLLRRPEMSASVPPITEPNRIISLAGGRRPIQEALGRAHAERVPASEEHLQEVMDFLRGHGRYGPERPEMLTPREGLLTRRGYGQNFVTNRQWNQVANTPTQAATKQGYTGITNELHEKVPGLIEADEAYHRLLPARTGLRTIVKKEPGLTEGVAASLGARTGSLAAPLAAAFEGARAGGPLGAIAAGGGTLLGKETLGIPTSKMFVARRLFSPSTGRAARALLTPEVGRLISDLRSQNH